MTPSFGFAFGAGFVLGFVVDFGLVAIALPPLLG
jgi:hypothetical protein